MAIVSMRCRGERVFNSIAFSGTSSGSPEHYRVSWTGAGFHSPEIVLRILPEEAR